MPDIMNRIGDEVLVIDGAFGSMLERYSVPPEQCPAQLNATAPDIIADIHKSYVLAGAHCITSNSFGASRPKLAEYGLEDQVDELNRAAVRLAREAKPMHVLADVGPTGLVLAPLGETTFDELFETFAEQVRALASGNPDAIIIETMTDIAESRCAVLAAKDVCDLPVFATVTFGLNGRMDLSGTDPETAAVILEAAGADAVGMNCGLGPEQMLPLVERMAQATSLPIVVLPNAGLPTLAEGETVFPGTADEMGEHAALFVEAGAAAVGSCCGSTPEFTGAIMDFTAGKDVADRADVPGVALAGPRGILRLGQGYPMAVIGERINPTGKPALADSLREGSTTVVRSLAVEQQEAGAHALDVNVGAPEVDALTALTDSVLALTGISDVPLVLDTTDVAALEAALRAYPGRALINSVNGSAESMESVLPLASTYGAAVVVLALDDDGIPETPEGRLGIVDRVRTAAYEHGLTDADLIVDLLTMTAATDPRAASVTLEALRVVSAEWGLATVLGVSNVSHGLPGRPALNAAFLTMAAAKGLDAAIINPSDIDVTRAVKAADVLLGNDQQAAAWVAWAQAEETAREAGGVSPSARSFAGGEADGGHEVSDGGEGPHRGLSEDGGTHPPASPEADLASAIERGDSDAAPELVERVISAGRAPDEVIGEVLTPAIQRLGDAFGRGEVFLPQLMVSADAMKSAVAQVKTHLPDDEGSSEGRVAFATVKGDIHSIGKDICVSLLESQGFVVDDLGVDVAVERVAEAAGYADAVCLSALMTTTLPAMEQTVAEVEQAAPGTPVLVGGAVVTEAWADSIGAGYSDDAPGCVEAVRAAVKGVDPQ
jgi:5-methyltetrahydrofolate--homocysteine methyltransferase